MNVLIGLIILSAFLQTSFIGINIVLLFLVCRSFIVESRMNYFLAFFVGLLISILAVQNLGFWALVFLIAVKIGHVFGKLPFNRGLLTALPAIALSVFTATVLQGVIEGQTINWNIPVIEIVIGIPIYFFLSFWEDRFMVHTSNVKLKLRK